LDTRPDIYNLVKDEITSGEKNNNLGRKDRPTVEQIVRAAIYKEVKKLSYRELEYEQYDSRICEVFLKLSGRKPFSHEIFHKYISRISGESLHNVLVFINKIAIEEGLEDGKKIRPDTTVIETNIHYPTNNSLTWDCIKEIHRILKKLKEMGVGIKVRNYQKQAKKNFYKINNTSSQKKREEEFKKQLKIFRGSINQAEKICSELFFQNGLGLREGSLLQSLKDFLPTAEKVYDITYRHEVLGEQVPNDEKIFSIYEKHTDVIVKGKRDV
jgi:IS5 family transposase